VRDLTRTRTAVTRERTRELPRLEKLLEDSGIKLSSVASDITGVSGRAMLEALITGQRDPAVLAGLAKRRLRQKIPALTEALTGRFSEHHAFLTRVHLNLIDQHTQAIEELTNRIEVMIEPFRGFRDLICTIPGISTGTADVVIAETGADRSRQSSRSSTPYSRRSGTSAPTAPSTTTQAQTPTPDSTPTKPNTTPSNSYAPWATPSHSNPPGDEMPLTRRESSRQRRVRSRRSAT
jgi:transposase